MTAEPNITINIHTDYIYLDSEEQRNLTTHINRNGDLIGSSYLSITLPPINTNINTERRPTEQIIYRRIQREKEQCVISYSKIKPKCKYWKCDGCNNAGIFSYINTWFQSHNTCPACRKEYNFTQGGITYYINSDKNNKTKKNNC
jgi:hypothetical protein